MENRRYRIEYTDTALEDLSRIAPVEADRITRKVFRLELGLHGNIKRLQNADFNYRLRMGDYRVMFDVVKDQIIVQRIKHRRDAYE